MTLHWEKLTDTRWDRERDAIFGDAELAAVGMARPAVGDAVADEWWRVTADDGTVLGYGWLDVEWGDAQITFLVAHDRRGEGVGTFVVDRLEQEAAARGVRYVYNVVPATHPNRTWMTGWLVLRGFRPSGDRGELRRQVRAGVPAG